MKIKNLDVSFTLSDIEGELVIVLSDEEIMTTVNLNYRPDPENWKENKSELSWEDPYYFIVADLIIGLKERYVQLLSHDANPIPFLTEELNTKISELGLAGIAKKDFDIKNAPNHVPTYHQFITAFKHFSGLTEDQFTVTCLDAQLIIKAGKDVWEMDTFEGRTALLKSYVEKKSYDDIYTDTNEQIWNLVYHENGVDKQDLYPILLREWRDYADQQTDVIQDDSWKFLQELLRRYDQTHDLVLLAYEIDEYRIYPILVTAMLKLCNDDDCYLHYCEEEFFGGNDEWEAITDETDGDAPVFFMRPHH